MKLNFNKMFDFVKDWFMINLGLILTALGLVVFLFPNKVVAGGISGVAFLLNSLVKSIPTGVWMYILNFVLFVLAFLFVGKEFGAKTIVSSFLLSFYIDLFDRIIKIPVYNGGDILLSVFFGVLLTAGGMSLAFSRNASTGGTDIIARIINKFFYIPVGKALLFADFTIGVLTGFRFSFENALYSLLAIIFNGLAIDFILRGFQMSTQLLIISNKADEILEYVLKKIGRGATIIPSIGGYTGEKKRMLMVIIRRKQLGEVLNKIRKIDPSAFIIIKEVRQVIGKGFQKFDQML